MTKSSYLSSSYTVGCAAAGLPDGPHASTEYEGFGSYNRTAMARVARSWQRPATLETTYVGADNLPVGVTHNDSILLVKRRTKRTWDGVFLPVSVSIFGVVLFFRLPWVIGECGLWLSFVGIALSFFVTLLVTCSLAAISTNGYVGDGGAYMMISRCLGPQLGVTIGTALVLANTLASAMYLVGGVNAVAPALGNDTLTHWLTTEAYSVTVVGSSLTLLFLLLVSLLKLDRFFQLVCFALALVAMLNFVVSAFVRTTPLPAEGYTGVSGETLRDNWSPQFSDGTDFQEALFVLFPGVCGLMCGIAGSGELRNGPKAIPKGVMYAWFLSLGTYLVTAVVVAASFERSFLKTDYHILERASFWPAFIPGEFTASFAAVLSGLVGSSRVLNAIAADDILPLCFFQWLARCRPQVSVLLLYAATQVLLLFGNSYTLVSAFTTQIFLATFLSLNVSVFLSSAVGLTSFRPTFSFFNTLTALTGALASLTLMFFIDPLMASGVLLFLLVALVLADVYIDPARVYWGDASQPLLFHIVRKFLLRLDERRAHVRHWRPSIIHVVTDPLCSLNLIHLANNMKKGGLYEVGLVLGGDFHSTTKSVFRWKGWLMDFIEASGVKAFPVVMSAADLRFAVQSMLRLCGLGSMRPNTLLLSMDELLQRDHFDAIYAAFRKTAVDVSSPRASAEEQIPEEGGGEGHGREGHPAQPPPVSRRIPSPAAQQAAAANSMAAVQPNSPLALARHGVARRCPLTSGSASYRRRHIIRDDTDEASLRAVGVSPPFPHGEHQADNWIEALAEEQSGLFSPQEASSFCSSFVLPPEVHTLPELSFCGVREAARGEEESLEPEEDWSEWLKQSMCGSGRLVEAAAADATSEARPPRGPSSAVEHAARERQHGEGGRTQNTPTRKYRTPRPLRWGLFRSGRTDADEDDEQRLVEQMILHRQNAQLLGGPDLVGYRDTTEFCCIVRDAVHAFMNVVIARNMDLLDTEAIEEKGKERKWFIDVWLPDEDDVALFLMAHCLRLTSIWERHAVVRVVSVVALKDDVPQEVKETHALLKAHRLVASPRVIALEEVMGHYGVSDVAVMARRFADPQTRPGVINALVRAEVERTRQRVALLMTRVPPFPPERQCTHTMRSRDGSDEDAADGGDGELRRQAEAWLDALREMTAKLPPCLLLTGGMLRCRSTDW
ncbi:putative solute carrier family 12 member 9-like [Trypanosoma conorhini]|uniref:Putative solute carrier family 12 member 9-like n=1 Tax=Trypanosoma conorhini TaxID=83891 RepID=A0A3R7NG76_9TRYP|nr:putative solute carrier family 12 member 9-like [Trypanosoma conorhini]RNF18135.1 putative solute carrier family 12 member 9-like [Trypanosoma conorhini]